MRTAKTDGTKQNVNDRLRIQEVTMHKEAISIVFSREVKTHTCGRKNVLKNVFDNLHFQMKMIERIFCGRAYSWQVLWACFVFLVSFNVTADFCICS